MSYVSYNDERIDLTDFRSDYCFSYLKTNGTDAIDMLNNTIRKCLKLFKFSFKN